MKTFLTLPLRTKAFFALIFVVGFSSRAVAADDASAQMISSSLGGGEFQYTITLDNIGSNNLGTFWYSWVPGEDFLPSTPTGIVSPTGWTANITHGGAGDGFAIQWVTSSNALASNSTLNFTFDSTATPATMASDSPFYPTTPIGTSFVYSGGPFSDSGFEFDVQSIPEPSSAALLLGGGLVLALLARRLAVR